MANLIERPAESEAVGLMHAVVVATTECTALMNEQFIALVATDSDIARFDVKIVEAVSKRRAAMEALHTKLQASGW